MNEYVPSLLFIVEPCVYMTAPVLVVLPVVVKYGLILAQVSVNSMHDDQYSLDRR